MLMVTYCDKMWIYLCGSVSFAGSGQTRKTFVPALPLFALLLVSRKLTPLFRSDFRGNLESAAVQKEKPAVAVSLHLAC